MLRDMILDKINAGDEMFSMPQMGEMNIFTILSKAVSVGIAESRAMSMDTRALDVIKYHFNNIKEDDYLEVIERAHFPYPNLWLEYAPAKNVRWGALIMQRDEIGGLMVIPFVRQEDMILPPIVILNFDPDLGGLDVVPTPWGDFFEGLYKRLLESRDFKLEEYFENIAYDFLGYAVVLSILLEARDVFEIREGERPSRQARRYAEKHGNKLPAQPVGVLDLARLGHIEHRAIISGSKDPDHAIEVDDEGPDVDHRKRKAHWVRGHMFVARNKKITYRKPHIRGLGKATGKAMFVTSTQPPPTSTGERQKSTQTHAEDPGEQFQNR